MLTRSVVKAVFVYILLLLALAFVLVLAARADGYWEAPKVLNACGTVTILWDKPPVPFDELGVLSGSLWADNVLYDLVVTSENPPVFETGVPQDATEFNAFITGEVYGAVVAKQPIRCNYAWLPFIQLNR